MNSSQLLLNTNKTKVLAVGSASHLSLVDSDSAKTGASDILFKTSVKYACVPLPEFVPEWFLCISCPQV